MEGQAQLLNTETKSITPNWVDPEQPLLVPVNPLHYVAHKYQLILARLDQQAAKNGAQFNSGNYIQIMEKLEKLWEAINAGKSTLDDPVSTSNDAGTVGELPAGAASRVGKDRPVGVGAGVQTENPVPW